VLGLVFAYPFLALGADPVVSTPLPEPAEVPAPVVTPPAQMVNEKPKPVERPKPAGQVKPVEKPKPAEKPRVAADSVQPPVVTASKPVEPPAPAAVPAPAPANNGIAKQGEASAGYSFGCLALSFAMLILGVAAGFLGRHLMSRHKLGGMTVRIGTWRGIP
jgi:hypothetical protein